CGRKDPGDPTMTCRARASRLFLLIAGVLAVGGWATRAASELLAQPQAAGAGASLKRVYYGNKACGGCHNYSSAEEAKAKLYSDEFTRGTEMHVWYEQDKHKDATDVLLKPRSQQIAKLMGIEGDLTREKQCVSCHGVYVEKE